MTSPGEQPEKRGERDRKAKRKVRGACQGVLVHRKQKHQKPKKITGRGAIGEKGGSKKDRSSCQG